jgi:hypothetical protein
LMTLNHFIAGRWSLQSQLISGKWHPLKNNNKKEEEKKTEKKKIYKV